MADTCLRATKNEATAQSIRKLADQLGTSLGS
jgi:hypothetical protein